MFRLLFICNGNEPICTTHTKKKLSKNSSVFCETLAVFNGNYFNVCDRIPLKTTVYTNIPNSITLPSFTFPSIRAKRYILLWHISLYTTEKLLSETGYFPIHFVLYTSIIKWKYFNFSSRKIDKINLWKSKEWKYEWR